MDFSGSKTAVISVLSVIYTWLYYQQFCFFLISVDIHTLYLLTFHFFCCYIYPHKTVRSMFRLTFLFRQFWFWFMSIDCLQLLFFWSNFSLCKLRQWSLSGPFCSCLFLKNCSRRRENTSSTPRLFFAEVSTKHLPRFSLQAQFKASNVSTWRTFSSSRLFPTMTQGISRMFGRTLFTVSKDV